MAPSAKLYAFCYVLSHVCLVRCETSVTPERSSRFLAESSTEPNGPYVKLTSGRCLPHLQVSKEDCLAAAKAVVDEMTGSGFIIQYYRYIFDRKTELDGGRDDGMKGRPHGCTFHNWGNAEWWGHSDNAECGHWNYNCVCKREDSTTTTTMTTTTASFQLSHAEIVSVLGLAGAVHEEVDIESEHLHGFQEQLVVEDVHSSPVLGNGTDYARVYTKGCTGDFCEHCAIAFTATTDQWDFMEDLNISRTPFCGLQEVHAGFAQEMRTYMQQSNWPDAVNLMSSQRCGKAYAVGTSLGGAIASLFAFCANRFDGNAHDSDKSYFPGSFNIIPVTFGAPAIAKEEVYNGEPGQCFQGARVGIQQAQSFTLDADSTMTSLSIISGLLQGVGKPNANLDSGIAQLHFFSNINDDAQFLALRNEIIELELPGTIIALTELLMNLVGEGPVDIATFAPLIAPLDQLMMLITNTTLGSLLGPIANENLPMPAIGIEPDFAFEFDVVPSLLSGFKFKHPKMPFHPVRHPEGVDPPVEEVVQCDVSDHRPEADFLQVLWSSIAALALPALTRQPDRFGAGFPNHHLCCYLRSLTGLPAGSCGVNPATQEAYKCDRPSWR